jgi:hypothetical protein
LTATVAGSGEIASAAMTVATRTSPERFVERPRYTTALRQ